MHRRCGGRAATAFVVTAAALALAASAPAAKPNPENDKRLGPDKNAGYFLGYPSPTYSWHGCTKVDSQHWHINLATRQPTTQKGTSRYVTFTVLRGGGFPRFAWKVKPGWRICGVQAAVQLSNATVDSDLLAETGYTSGPTAGSTSPTGKETVKVTIPRNGIRKRGFEKYEGKTFSIVAFQSVSVFVKKK
jgi:hypothetical protein